MSLGKKLILHLMHNTYTCTGNSYMYMCIPRLSLCCYLQVSILVGELSGQFSSLKQQIDDPFLVSTCTCTCAVHVYTGVHVKQLTYIHTCTYNVMYMYMYM